jgi:hypothetical protein
MAKSIPPKTPPSCNASSSKFHSWHYTCCQLLTWATREGLQCPWQISYWCGNQWIVHVWSHWAALIYPFCWYCLVMSNTHLSASFCTGKCSCSDI